MNITLRQLEVFCAIARRGNVSRAAEDTAISQSAASMALAELERQLDEKLFDRFSKKLVLNDNGRALFPKAVDLLARAEEIQGLYHPGSQTVAALKAGASSTVGNYLMPGLLGACSRARPNLHISLQVGNTEQIIQALLDCEIDIGFIEGICRDPDIEQHDWRTDELIVIASPLHPLAKTDPLTPQNLTDAHWILRERGSGTREIFERALSGKISHLNIRYDLGHTEAIKQAVRNNLGISCLSRLAVQDELESGRLVELSTPFLSLQRKLCMLVRKGKYLTGSLEQFIRFVQDPPADELPVTEGH
jgi:DNA-binding transcriptional LysR family regulator